MEAVLTLLSAFVGTGPGCTAMSQAGVVPALLPLLRVSHRVLDVSQFGLELHRQAAACQHSSVHEHQAAGSAAPRLVSEMHRLQLA